MVFPGPRRSPGSPEGIFGNFSLEKIKKKLLASGIYEGHKIYMGGRVFRSWVKEGVCTVKRKGRKSGPRLTPEKRSAMIQEIRLGVLGNTEIAKKYGISEQAVGQMRKRMKETEPPKPLSVLEMKKILNLDKADSFLVFMLEKLEGFITTTNEPTKERAMYLDSMSKALKASLDVRNSLAMAPIQEEQGITELDYQLVNEFMDSLPEDKQKTLLYIMSGGKKDDMEQKEPTNKAKVGGTPEQTQTDTA